MMSNVMAILQDVDKCMRCNGCVISCKRTWKMRADDPGVHKVSADQRVCIKSQKKVDMGPFLRYSCWHCPDPPCAPECPFKAITKEATGAVAVDQSKCQPDLCKVNGRYPCVVGCQRGGYPKIGTGSDQLYGSEVTPQPHMQKCTLCFGKSGADDGVTGASSQQLPTRAAKNLSGQYISTLGAGPDTVVPELAHEPACVYTCPAKAMTWDTQANIKAYLATPANGFILPDGTHNWVGNGSVFWASRKVLLAPPKADPFVEDHLIPSAGSIPTLGVVPVLAVGGLLAYSARRSRMEEATEGGEE
jgi:Fe-S-cluster-containing dehydrogenase component